MKKNRFLFFALFQILITSLLFAQGSLNVDTVCVGEVKTYFIDPENPPYAPFDGGIDTVYSWALTDPTKGDIVAEQETEITISWVTFGDVQLQFTESIVDDYNTTCSRINHLNIHIFDNVSEAEVVNPQDVSAVFGETVTFTSGLTVGNNHPYGSITYQWQYSADQINWANVPTANFSILNFMVNAAGQEGYYRCRVSGACSEAFSTPARLKIRGLPVIISHPQPATICEGSPQVITFSVLVSCDEGDIATYQWQKRRTEQDIWENIPGATDSVYVIDNPQVSDEGFYQCLINSTSYPNINLASNSCYFEVIENMVVYFTANNVSCNGANDGSIAIDSVLNGNAPYVYLWSNGSTASHIENLAPGRYTVQITEGSASGCTIEKIIEIDEPDPIRLGIDTVAWEYAQWINGQDQQQVEDLAIDKLNHIYYQTGSFETELKYDNNTIASNNSGTFDMFVSKVADGGNVLWTRHAGGSDFTYGKGVGYDRDGNVYVAGSFKTTICFYRPGENNGQIFLSTGFTNNNYDYDYDGYIVKYDANGNYLTAINFGGIYNDFIHDIHVTPDGQVLVTGSFEGEVTCGGQTITSGAAANAFVAKFNNDLSLRWMNAFENQPFEQVGTSVVSDIADNAYISGYYLGENLTQKDLFIARFDYAGNLKWTKTINGSHSLTDGSLAVDYSECVYHTGTFVNQAQLRESDGTPIHNYVSAGGSDGFVQKFDRNGYLRWATTVGGTGEDTVTTVAVDVLNNTYVAGNSNGSIAINDYTLTSEENATNAFIIKYSNVEPTFPYTPNIPPVWGTMLGGVGYQSADNIQHITTVEVDNDQNLFVGGDFTFNAQFGDSTTLTAVHPKDAFVAKLNQFYQYKAPIIVDAICPEEPSGSIQIFVAGGTPPYVYIWSIEGDTAILSNIESGRYWYWIGDHYNTWQDTVCGLHGNLYVNHLYNAPATPNYLTVDNNDFCAGSLDPDQITITAHTIPTNDTDSIFWLVGDCFTGTPITGIVGHPAADEYTLTIPAPTDTITYYAYWQSEFCGRSLCAAITINVRPQPIMPEEIISDANNFCVGSVDTIRLTAIGGAGDILEWMADCTSDVVIGTGTQFSFPVPTDTTTYYARWKNDCGFSDCQSITINVIPYPDAVFSGLAEDYCNTSAIDTLTGYPEGGTWTGAGLTVISESQAIFNPITVAPGVYEIAYTVSYDGCDSTFTAVTTVYPVPMTDFAGLDTTYCYDDADVLLVGNYAPFGTFSCDVPDAIQNLGNGKALFQPVIAGIGGPYNITYSYADVNTGCESSITKTTKVIKPVLTIQGLPETACANEEYIIIHGVVDGSYYGGTFSGIGIAGHLEAGVALFDPHLEIGTYTITLDYVNYLGCTSSISQTIEILEIPLPVDTAYVVDGTLEYCFQSVETLTLKAEGGNGTTINWYSGTCGETAQLIATGDQVEVEAPQESTSLFVRWENNCGASSCYELPIIVDPLPIATIEERYDICSNESVTIEPENADDNLYVWMELESGVVVGNEPTITLSPDYPTWYRQIITNRFQCVDSMDFLVFVSEAPALDLGEDLYILSCDSVELNAGEGIGFDHYLWQDGSTEPTYWVSETGVYYVTVYNDGCSVTDTIYVELCSDKLFVPNAFTPNGDGMNDRFRVQLTENTLRAEMYIYARNGQLIYQTNQITEGWDGKDFDGKDCPSGTYAYMIKYFVKMGGGRTIEKSAAGSVILLK